MSYPRTLQRSSWARLPILCLAALGCRDAARATDLVVGAKITWSPPLEERFVIRGKDFLPFDSDRPRNPRPWMNKTALSWSHATPIRIDIDFGAERAVKGVLLETGAGESHVEWPRAILAYGSDDGAAWTLLGLLTSRAPDVAGFSRRVYRLAVPGYRMRMVRLSIAPGGEALTFVTDGIHVVGGDGPGRELPNAGPWQPSVDFQRALASQRKRSSAAPSMRPAQNGTIVLWHKHRYAPLSPQEPPASTARPVLSITAAKGVVRGDTLLITNRTGRTQRMGVWTSAALNASFVPWTSTNRGSMVSTAIPWTRQADLPPGETARVWVQADTSRLKAGDRAETVSVSWQGSQVKVPVRLHVGNVDLSKPTLSLGAFDYANEGGGSFDLKPSQVPSMINVMRRSAVDTVWGSPRLMPIPAPSDYGPSGELRRPLGTRALLAWLQRTRGFRTHLLVVSAKSQFVGVPISSPAFAPRVRSWSKSIWQTVSKSIGNGRFGVLLVDEPSTLEQARVSLAWLRALKSGAPKIKVFIDPLFRNLDDPVVRALLREVDMVCLHRRVILGDPALRGQYLRLVRPGQELWVYDTAPEAKLLDPTVYYRGLAYSALSIGAKGVLFWSLADDGQAKSSWSEETALRSVYTPLFLGGVRVDESLQWKALLEGLEDHRLYTALYRRSRGKSWQSAADAVIRDAKLWGASTSGTTYWSSAPTPAIPDLLRARALHLLESH